MRKMFVLGVGFSLGLRGLVPGFPFWDDLMRASVGCWVLDPSLLGLARFWGSLVLGGTNFCFSGQKFTFWGSWGWFSSFTLN